MNDNLKDKIKYAVLGDRDDARAGKHKRSPLMILVIVLVIIGGLKLSTFVFAPDPVEDYWGKILVPEAGSVVGKEFFVVGETQDIPSGSFVWVVIENIGNKTCLPRKRVLRNTRFRTKILNQKSEIKFTIAIHIVDKPRHLEWTDRIEQDSPDEIPVPVDTFRLDSVSVSLK